MAMVIVRGGPSGFTQEIEVGRHRLQADEPVEALRAQHEAQGLHLDAWTTSPRWLGERLDLGYAIDVLHPLANSRLRSNCASETLSTPAAEDDDYSC